MGANRTVAAALLVAAGTQSAHASETISYTYDARGRLVQVTHTGSVNNNLQTTYTQDKTDNRTNVKTTGSPN